MPVASDQGGASFQLPPEGLHPARCIQVVDLGTQEDAYMGKPRITRKVRIAWELVDQKAVFDEERGEESFMIGQDYTLSLGEKANLRHTLESWRGKQFSAEELKGFDLSVLLRKPCMVNIIHKISGNKRTYATVTTVTPVPKGIEVAKPTLDCVVYDIDMGQKNENFSKLPQWIQEKVSESLEARGLSTEKVAKRKTAGGNGPTGEVDEDNNPF
jgi:hypothetical protein